MKDVDHREAAQAGVAEGHDLSVENKIDAGKKANLRRNHARQEIAEESGAGA